MTDKLVDLYIRPLIRTQLSQFLFPVSLQSIPRIKTGKELAFNLFDEGKRPSSPELKDLGLKRGSLYVYFQDWKKEKKS